MVDSARRPIGLDPSSAGGRSLNDVMKATTTPPVPSKQPWKTSRRWSKDLARRYRQTGQPFPPPQNASYWVASRSPLASLTFVLPLIVIYEGWAAWAGTEASTSFVRTGADHWVRQFVATLGLPLAGLAPLAIIVGLIAWHVGERDSRLPRPWHVSLMLMESLFLAVVLIGVSRLLDHAISGLEEHRFLLQAASPSADSLGLLVGFLGAGLYEEALFRLALIPLLYKLLRLLQSPDLLAGTLAVTGSSLVFALAHHVGQSVEVFTWYVFFFRWMAGLFFAGLFLFRGFGIAVGAHAAYDVMVGWLDWHLY